MEALVRPNPDGIAMDVNYHGYKASGVPLVRSDDQEEATEYRTLFVQINQRLRSYRMFPEFLFRVGDQWVYRWTATSGRRLFPEPNEKIRPNEQDALLSLLSLARQGCLQRVRQCKQCGKWFFARFRTQNFCQTKCQQTYFRSSKEWKAHRREYMRKNRALHRSGKVK
jgi:predicted RNA-binding Zn ribbon-like protein